MSILRDLKEEIEEPRDRVRESARSDSKVPTVGEGKGVISSMAAIWGDEMVVPGETDPAEEWRCARIFGIRIGMLEAEELDRNRGSESID
jgi:hypothetical protein